MCQGAAFFQSPPRQAAAAPRGAKRAQAGWRRGDGKGRVWGLGVVCVCVRVCVCVCVKRKGHEVEFGFVLPSITR